MEGHAQNVSSVLFHPELPIVLSGSEDGTIRVWHANTHRLESTLNYGMERVWSMCAMKGNNNVAIGYDEGSIMVKVILVTTVLNSLWLTFWPLIWIPTVAWRTLQNRVCPSFRLTVRLSRRFLGIGSSVFSKFWHGFKNPDEVVHERAQIGKMGQI